MVEQARRTGLAAAVAGVLMTVGVEGEWLLDPQRDDGTVTSMPGFVVLLMLALLGFALLTYAVHGLGSTPAHRGRPLRAGATMSLVGAGLLTVFALLVLVSGVVSGSPLEPAFLAFALGLLLLAIGQAVWGASLRRRSPAPGVWQLLLLAGAMAFATVAIPIDPWHDVSLVAMFLAWSAIGVLLLRAAGSPATDHPSSPGSGATAQASRTGSPQSPGHHG